MSSQTFWYQDHFTPQKAFENPRELFSIWVIAITISMLEIKVDKLRILNHLKRTMTSLLYINTNNIFYEKYIAKQKNLMRRMPLFYIFGKFL